MTKDIFILIIMLTAVGVIEPRAAYLAILIAILVGWYTNMFQVTP